MEFLHHTFNDLYIRKENWLTRVDVRIKLLYLVLLLTINLWAKNVYISLLFLSMSLVLMSLIKIHLTSILRNMLLPASFAILILLIKGLHEGDKEWLSFSIIGYKLVLKKEGLLDGLNICGKIMGGISLIMLFSYTTSVSQLCAGLKWFRVPDTIIELLSFICRYISVLLEEVSTMWTAQKSRLGYSSWKRTIKSFGNLGGMLIIRAVEKAERTGEAMRARGYEGGSTLTINLPQWSKREYALVLALLFTLPILIYTGNAQVW